MWTPLDNKYFETFSYLPPLTDDEIAKQIDYIVNNGELHFIHAAATGARGSLDHAFRPPFCSDHNLTASPFAIAQASSPPWSSLRPTRRTCS